MRTRTKLLITTAVIWAGAGALLAMVVQPGVTATPSDPLRADPSLLQTHVKKLSVDLYPRSFDQFNNLEASANYILEQFKAAGATVSVQNVVVQEATYKNVIAKFGPQKGPVIIVGAHYDSHGDIQRGLGSPNGVSPSSHTPGADDNASGVAGLLELARLLGKQPQARSIELVAYTLEEPPHFRGEHMGSVWHARSVKAAKRDVRLMLSLEMIGYFSDEPGSQSYAIPAMKYLYSDRGNFIALVGKFSDFGATREAKSLMSGATDLPVYSINAPRILQGIDYSDHRSYWSAGYPALMVTDTAFLRNHQYHQAGDTFDKLDYSRMAKVVQSVYAVTQKY
jgi:Zn-dependent M28 family amino/carboxypeptidase